MKALYVTTQTLMEDFVSAEKTETNLFSRVQIENICK